MALEKKELVALYKQVLNGKRTGATSYSIDGQNVGMDVAQALLLDNMRELSKDEESYEENKKTIFALIKETLTDVMPKEVLSRYGELAEVKTFGQGDRPVFTHKLGRRRAKQFITKVGLNGVYEVFQLGQEKFEVQTNAMGGAAQIGYEEMLDGNADFGELTQIVMEGMDELIYREIAVALKTAINQLPEANRVDALNFDAQAFDRLIATVRAYGEPVIYCSYEFAAKMKPDTEWSDRMKDEYSANGYFTNYKNCKVVILPQSFEDETNSVKVIDPGYCYIIPSGSANSRPVKIAFEGTVHVREQENYDWSKDIQVYQKVGVATMMTNDICVYTDTALAGHLSNLPSTSAKK